MNKIGPPIELTSIFQKRSLLYKNYNIFIFAIFLMISFKNIYSQVITENSELKKTFIKLCPSPFAVSARKVLLPLSKEILLNSSCHEIVSTRVHHEKQPKP